MSALRLGLAMCVIITLIGGLCFRISTWKSLGNGVDPVVFTASHYHFVVAEDAVPGTVVSVVQMESAGQEQLSFAIEGGDPGCAFRIDPDGTLRVQGALDFETIPEHSLIIRATRAATRSK